MRLHTRALSDVLVGRCLPSIGRGDRLLGPRPLGCLVVSTGAYYSRIGYVERAVVIVRDTMSSPHRAEQTNSARMR